VVIWLGGRFGLFKQFYWGPPIKFIHVSRLLKMEKRLSSPVDDVILWCPVNIAIKRKNLMRPRDIKTALSVSSVMSFKEHSPKIPPVRLKRVRQVGAPGPTRNK
jgi:hypothetical protein